MKEEIRKIVVKKMDLIFEDMIDAQKNAEKYYKQMTKVKAKPSRKHIEARVANNYDEEIEGKGLKTESEAKLKTVFQQRVESKRKSQILSKALSPKSDSADKEYIVYWYTLQLDEYWRPELRESPGFLIDKNKMYLFGGLGKQMEEDLCVLDCGGGMFILKQFLLIKAF
jgi:hypothetical protein